MTSAQEKPTKITSDDIVVTKNGDYLIKGKAFGEMWAYLNYLEGRVIDLKKEADSWKEANNNAILLSSKVVIQRDELQEQVWALEATNKKLEKKIRRRFGLGEVVGITAGGIVVGVFTGLVIAAAH